ncbi:alpha/beta fold hydrolase [Plantactinospora sonchi]|uniref:Alpha/beta hydrolase n=1 Tax=Plantactinospora sonchi TaxID=1544735 RepID=A0ABU7RSJ0_9ACTN
MRTVYEGNDNTMADYLDVNGVHMWFDERGAGEPLVLLHGGLTDSRCFTGNLDRLADRFRLLLPDRRGHGHTADVPGPITIALMAEDTIGFVEKTVGGPVRLAGYSAGAAVALQVAVRRPELVDRLVLVSGAYHPDGMIFRPTAGGTPPAPLLAAYAEVSPDGADHFPVVINKIVQAVDEEPGLEPAQLGAVTCPTLVMAADDDLVTLEHTLALYRALSNSQLAIVPNTSHLLLDEKPEFCAGLIGEFLSDDHPATWMPIRRAGTRPATSAEPTAAGPGAG